MKPRWKALFAGLGGFVLMVGFQGSAFAGCGFDPASKGASLKVAVWDAQPARFVLVDNDQDPIVGMWKVVLTAGGSTFDWGYSQWHGDGTEILNSGTRAPATENFCLGVWKRTAHNAYKLNHFALSYDAATGQLNATVNIRENVLLDQGGNTFSGTFTVDVFLPDGTQVAHIEGTIAGQRVTAD